MQSYGGEYVLTSQGCNATVHGVTSTLACGIMNDELNRTP